MIETRTYEGDAATIADFAARIWQNTYAGKMMLPLWERALFRLAVARGPAGRSGFLGRRL